MPSQAPWGKPPSDGRRNQAVFVSDDVSSSGVLSSRTVRVTSAGYPRADLVQPRSK